MDRPPDLPRRRFLHLAGTAAGLAATSACASTARSSRPGDRTVSGTSAPGVPPTVDRTYTPSRLRPVDRT